MLGHELIAIDGCKMPSNASRSHSGTFKVLMKKRDKIRARIEHALSEHQRFDVADDVEAARREAQRAETLRHAAERIDAFLTEASPRLGQGKQKTEVKSNITDNESANMKTSHGVIQGYNGVSAVDRKHQVIVNAEVFGAGPEQHTLVPVLDSIKERYQRMGIATDVFSDGLIVTADTGFSNESNMQHCFDAGINAYIPDNQFRSRDPRYKDRLKEPSRQREAKHKKIFAATAFQYDPIAQSCHCPSGKAMLLKKQGQDAQGNQKVFFEGRLTDCRACPKQKLCMRNPGSADTRQGHGRQVSFMTEKKHSFTEWMRQRVDTDKGRAIYSHRMHVVEPVFGNIESNKGLNRFTLRSKTKVQSQWLLYSLVHNVEKLQRYGRIAA